jgi:hypothetical protein
MAHLTVIVPSTWAHLSEAVGHLACHAPPTPGTTCRPRHWPKPTTPPFHRAPHADRRPTCWLHPLVPLKLEKSSFDSSVVLTPFHISPLLWMQVRHRRAAGPSDTGEAPHTPKGLGRPVLHPWARRRSLFHCDGLTRVAPAQPTFGLAGTSPSSA